MGVKWFKNKKMIVNPGKFLANILDKKNQSYTGNSKNWQ